MSVWPSIWLTLELALLSSAILLVVAAPLAWWLTVTRNRLRPIIEAITALPLVLPPTVLGFYLLILFSPNNSIGQFWVRVTGDTLAFSFTGLLFASVIYSLPFAVQPLRTAFTAVGSAPREMAATLGASPLQVFRTVVLPLSKRGFLGAAVLSFAHTLGEFGVVLMVGGNIPGRTRVIAIEIYNRAEILDYATTHKLAAGLLVSSFLTLAVVFFLNRERNE